MPFEIYFGREEGVVEVAMMRYSIESSLSGCCSASGMHKDKLLDVFG
jgi:hypothetical protein